MKETHSVDTFSLMFFTIIAFILVLIPLLTGKYGNPNKKVYHEPQYINFPILEWLKNQKLSGYYPHSKNKFFVEEVFQYYVTLTIPDNIQEKELDACLLKFEHCRLNTEEIKYDKENKQTILTNIVGLKIQGKLSLGQTMMLENFCKSHNIKLEQSKFNF